MIRWIVLLAVVLVPFMAAAQSSDSSVCSDVLTKVAECFANSNTTAAFPTSDTSSCKGCFTNQNFFDNYDPTKASCDTANSEICEYLNICQQESLRSKSNMIRQQFSRLVLTGHPRKHAKLLPPFSARLYPSQNFPA